MIEAVMYGLIAPWGLALLTSLWVYPAAFEELIKWGILQGTMAKGQGMGRLGAMVGLAFGISEAVLFSLNSWTRGEWNALIWRVLLTVPMHAVNGALVGVGLRTRYWWVTLLLAMLIHGLFNYFVTN